MTLNRRRFLQQTVAFSAVAALRPGLLAQSAPPPDPAAQHLFAIGDWGTDKYLDQQIAVSKSMQTWAQRSHITPGAMFAAWRQLVRRNARRTRFRPLAHAI